MNSTLITALRERLQQPLPGEEARYRMAPSYRPKLTAEEIAARQPKIGAVLLLLYEKDGTLHTVFTQRKSYDGPHSGQMSFPGGKRESDEDVVQTALRETHEEVGVAPIQIEVLGKLTELYIPPSNFLVYPSIGFAQHITRFVPQEDEVEEVVEIPVAHFVDERNFNLQTEIKLYNGTVVRVPAIHFGKHIIWGATALMLAEFTYLLEELRP